MTSLCRFVFPWMFVSRFQSYIRRNADLPIFVFCSGSHPKSAVFFYNQLSLGACRIAHVVSGDADHVSHAAHRLLHWAPTAIGVHVLASNPHGVCFCLVLLPFVVPTIAFFNRFFCFCFPNSDCKYDFLQPLSEELTWLLCVGQVGALHVCLYAPLLAAVLRLAAPVTAIGGPHPGPHAGS